jgi:hypothetical protein
MSNSFGENTAEIYGPALAQLYGRPKPRSARRRFARRRASTSRPSSRARLYWHAQYIKQLTQARNENFEEERTDAKFLTPDTRGTATYHGLRSSNTFRSGQQTKLSTIKGAARTSAGVIYQDGKQQRSKPIRERCSPIFCKGGSRAARRNVCTRALAEYMDDVEFDTDFTSFSSPKVNAARSVRPGDEPVHHDIIFNVQSRTDFPEIDSSL